VIDLQSTGGSDDDPPAPAGDSDDDRDHEQEEEEKQLAFELVRALETVGFVTVVNHGVSMELVQEAMAASRRFFSLSTEAKEKYAYRGHESNCGYIGLGRESHQDEYGADRKETFDIGPDDAVYGPTATSSSNDHDDAMTTMTAWTTSTTPWPLTELGPEFRETMRSYFEACNTLHLRLLRLIAIGLELSCVDTLVSKCNGRHCNLRLLHYPELAIPTRISSTCSSFEDHVVVIRGARHTDFGTLTLVAQDGVGGLRVQPIRDCESESLFSSSHRHDGDDWISVPPVEGALVVNVGDMLQRLTHGRLKATPHQVVSVLPAAVPPLSIGSENNEESLAPNNEDDKTTVPTIPERYSIAFFCNANKDTLLEPISELVQQSPDHANNSKHEPVTAWDYLTTRLAATIRST
jgi:isopenicillin N synthase-like dioxygenase